MKDIVHHAIQSQGLINGLISTSIGQPAPVVGMGCTYCIGSDRYPYTVVEVSKSGNKIGVIHDRTGSNLRVWPDQDWVITPGVLEVGQVPTYYTKRKDGRFRQQGESMRGGALSVGRRDYYRDPHF